MRRAYLGEFGFIELLHLLVHSIGRERINDLEEQFRWVLFRFQMSRLRCRGNHALSVMHLAQVFYQVEAKKAARNVWRGLRIFHLLGEICRRMDSKSDCRQLFEHSVQNFHQTYSPDYYPWWWNDIRPRQCADHAQVQILHLLNHRHVERALHTLLVLLYG
jgi:hypothetical protein